MVNPSFIEDTRVQLPGVFFSSVAWADYNGDSRPDFLLTGGPSGFSGISKLYLNTGTGFTEDTRVQLPGVSKGSVGWADYNGDGKPDLVLTGISITSPSLALSRLYLNTGSGFTQDTNIQLTNVYDGAVAWQDYNGDGKPDLLLTGNIGRPSNQYISKLYLNTGTSLTEDTSVQLLGVSSGGVAWQDYNGDSKPDLLLTGTGSLATATNPDFTTTGPSKLYLNTGTGFTEDTRVQIPGLFSGTVGWSDYNGDGKPDFLLTGADHFLHASHYAHKMGSLYLNTGTGFTEDTSFLSPFPTAYESAVAWQDYNGDGRPDFLLTGTTDNGIISKLYLNTATGFTEDTSVQLPGVRIGAVAWQDYNGDGKPDFLLTGEFGGKTISKLYLNNTIVPPVANNDTATTLSNTNVVVNIVQNDSDSDGSITGFDLNPQVAGVQNTFTNSQGVFSVDNTGGLTFTPASNFIGQATLPYGVLDNDGATSNIATVNINVQNRPPVVNYDGRSYPAASTLPFFANGGKITFNIGTNDSDPDGSITGFDLDFSQPGVQTIVTNSGGTFEVDNQGNLVITPVINGVTPVWKTYPGSPAFAKLSEIYYTALDNLGEVSAVYNNPSQKEQVLAWIQLENTAPVASDDITRGTTNQVLKLNISQNDSDAEIAPWGGITGFDLNPTVAGIQSDLTTAQGEYHLDAQGVLTFKPVAGFQGTASVPYVIYDTAGATATATASFIIENKAPIANNDTGTTNSNTAITLNIASNDSDLGGSITGFDLNPTLAGVQNTFTNNQGVFSVNNTGRLIFTPASNFIGQATLPYQAIDNDGATSNIATVNINVQNRPPVVNYDGRSYPAASTLPFFANGGKITFNIGTNDSDPDGSITGFDLDFSQPGVQTIVTNSGGTFEVDNQGNLVITPVINGVTPVWKTYPGSPAFAKLSEIYYTALDNLGAVSAVYNNPSQKEQVLAWIQLENTAPVANNDITRGTTNQVLKLNISQNDSDAEIAPWGGITGFDLNPTVAGIQSDLTTAQGEYHLDAQGVLTFKPVAGFQGTASVPYVIYDTAGATATATASFIIENKAPIATDDRRTITSNTSITLDIKGNDQDLDGSITGFDLNPSTATIDVTRVTSQGTYSVNNSGSLTFTPANNFKGTATLDYQAIDNDGATSNIATVSIGVQNQPPRAKEDHSIVLSNTTFTLNIGANDSDPDGNITGFDLDLNQAGVQTTGTLAGFGSYSVNNQGELVFTPATNVNNVTRKIHYQAIDNNGLPSNTSFIKIGLSDNRPIALDDETTINSQTTATTLNIGVNDTDLDGNITSWDLNPTNTNRADQTITTTAGTYSVNANGSLVFTPVAGFTGTDTLPYQVWDNSGASSNPAVITIVRTAAPTAGNDSTNTLSNTTVTLNLASNDSSPNGNITAFDLNPNTASIETDITNNTGHYILDNSGKLTFIPAKNYQGVASIPYRIVDNAGETATANINILVKDQAPVVTDDVINIQSNEKVTFNIGINDSDPDGRITGFDLNPGLTGIQTSATTAAGKFDVNNNGQVVFTPVNNYQGTATLAYQAIDNSGTTSNIATISVEVGNQAPIANDDSTNTLTNQTVTLNIGANDSDLDGSITGFDLDLNTTGVQNSISNSQGIFSVNNNGELVFTASSNFQGLANISYQAIDNSGATDNANVAIAVGDRPPVATDDSTNTLSNQSVTLNIGTNDSDPDGSIVDYDLDVTTAQVENNQQTSQGNFQVNNQGELIFTPAQNFQGVASLPYTVVDNSGATATANISITVGNQPPVATDDIRNTTSNQAATFNIGINDSDPDGSITGFDLEPNSGGIQSNITRPEGRYSVNNNGQLVFTPANNYQGTANIPYLVVDNSGATATATFTIIVNNQLPIANDDSTNTLSNRTVTLNIGANDSDPDGSITGFDLDTKKGGVQSSIKTPQGSYSVNNQGELVFRPLQNTQGLTVLEYQAIDNSGEKGYANIIVNVENAPPIANDDNTNTLSNQAVSLNIGANDSDPDGSITGFDLDTKKGGVQSSIKINEGSYSINNQGELLFKPNSNYKGTANLNYQVLDNEGATAGAKVTVVVSNQPPIAWNDKGNVQENSKITLNILSNDFDIDGSITGIDLNPKDKVLQSELVTTEGTFSVDKAGNLVFTPVRGFVGTANIPYQIIDNNGAKARAKVSIEVGDIPPIAVDDLTTTNQNQAVTLNILNNDIDPDGGQITGIDLNPSQAGVQNAVTTVHGIYQVNRQGDLVFTPARGFTGTAEIPYTIFDNNGEAATAKIQILVGNQPPIANPDITQTKQGEAVTLNILNNDIDPDGSITGIDLNPNQSGIQPQRTTSAGSFSVNNNGELTFRPANGFVGTANLPYQIIDNNGATAGTDVTIFVGDVPPVAVDDTVLTNRNQAVTFNILSNDFDVDGSITAVDLNPGQAGIQRQRVTNQGTYSVDGQGNVVFNPVQGFEGTANLPYQIIDNNGETAQANIVILVGDVPPIANDDSTFTNQNKPVTLNILSNDLDLDGSITAVDLNPGLAGIQRQRVTAEGTYSVDTAGNLVFTPKAGFTGQSNIEYQILDDDGVTANASAKVTIDIGDIPPVATDDTAHTLRNQAVTLNVLSNDSDPDGNITAVDLNPGQAGIQRQITTPEGTYSVDAVGNVVFRPAQGFEGIASIPYQIFDNSGVSATANIIIGVGDVPPIANDDSTFTKQNQPVTLNILTNDLDLDGSITAVDLNPGQAGIQRQRVTTEGTYSVDTAGNLVFTPKAGFTGQSSIEYQVIDNDGQTANTNAKVRIAVGNQPPIANNDNASTVGRDTITLNILSNDSDVDGSITGIDLNPNTAGVQRTFSNKQGIFSVDGNGNLTFTPAKGFKSGVATLPYTIFDNNGASATANINITVSETVRNILPVAVDDGTATNANQAVSLNILSNDFDVDGNITAVDLNPNRTGIQRNVTTPEGTFSVDTNGNLTFTPVSGFTGTATLEYQITDNSGATDIGNVNISVIDSNSPDQPPVAHDDATFTNVNQPVVLNILNNDFDADGSITGIDLNPNTAGIQRNVTTPEGTFSVAPNGNLTFTPVKDFSGTASIAYQIFDNQGVASTANISVLVLPPTLTNQPPVATNDLVSINSNQKTTVNVGTNDSDPDGSITAYDLDPSKAGIQSVVTTELGTFNIDNRGQLIFTPVTNQKGTASVAYQAIDNTGARSSIASINMEVKNQVPIVNPFTANIVGSKPVTLNIGASITDPDGSITGYDLDLNKAGIQNRLTDVTGTYSVDTSGNLVFTPDSNYQGTANITYQAIDNNGGRGIGTIQVVGQTTGGNQPPVVTNDLVSINSNQKTTVNVGANDSDPDGSITAYDLDPSKAGIQSVVTTELGTFNIDNRGQLIFTPATNQKGTASVAYQAIDNTGARSSIASINMEVKNQVPIVNPFTANIVGSKPVTLNIGASITDPDGSITGYDLDPNKAGVQNRLTDVTGTYSVDTSGNLVFTPDSNYQGTANITYQAIDNNGGRGIGTIQVVGQTTGGNQPPVAVDDGTATNANQSVSLNILNNDFDVDGSITAVDLNPNRTGIQRNVTTPEGTFSVDTNGNLTFTPVSGFTGIATLEYQITDNSGATDIGNVNISVIDSTSPDQPPVANNDATYTFVNQPVNLNILSNDFDADGSITVVDLNPNRNGIQEQVTTAQGVFSVTQDGELTFIPAKGFIGDATLEYQITDDLGATSTANITIAVIEEVTLPNQPPVANNDATFTFVNQSVEMNILSNDSDADGSITGIDLDPTTTDIEMAVTTSQGIFQVTDDGNLTFTPANGFVGVATLPYQIFDNNGASDTANIQITVEEETIVNPPIITEPDNQRPVAVYDTTTTTQNKPVTLNILTNDSDPDGQITAVDLNPDVDGTQRQITTDQGSFSLDNNGILTFVPVSNFTGVATLTYQVTDNDGLQDTAIINIRVNQASKPLEPIECDCEEPVLLDNTAQPVDVLNTVTGNDIIGTPANDNVFGTEASENIISDGGDDAIDGQAGNDNIIAGRGNDFILGEDGNDYILAERNDDIVLAGKDNDFVRGGKDDDLIGGESGNDTLFGDKGDDEIIGGRVDEEDTTGQDWLYGGLGNDQLDGQGGDDYLNGEEDNDSLYGGDGNDLLNGGENNDLLYGEQANDKIIGGNGEDTIYSGKDNDIALGNQGNDQLFGGDGNDTLAGNEGNDTLHGGNAYESSAVGSNGQQDYLSGGEGNDWILAEEGEDKLCGDAGNDTLEGGKDNDTLCGGTGDDWLQGELGDDTIISGVGNDLILLGGNDGQDFIADLQIGNDHLVLPQGVSFNQLTFSQSVNGTLITYEGADIGLLYNITPNNVTADLFKSL